MLAGSWLLLDKKMVGHAMPKIRMYLGRETIAMSSAWAPWIPIRGNNADLLINNHLWSI